MFNTVQKNTEIRRTYRYSTFSKINSFPRNCRLDTAADFTATMTSDYQLNGNLIQVCARINGLKYPRLGLIVSKKIERLAVKRNWVKRILRETFRSNRCFAKTNLAKMDWVIRLRRPITKTKEDSVRLTTEARILMMQLQQCHD
ncbi:MAG TPA: ribonuclease P protein component [Nitrosomonas sp.]|nr:ribonuclease P protein component [Nitrosomonas sp.]